LPRLDWAPRHELESKLGRAEQRRNYSDRADRLIATYVKTLFNFEEWLACMVEERGRTLHDYVSRSNLGSTIQCDYL
jgi:hypothetical protein